MCVCVCLITLRGGHTSDGQKGAGSRSSVTPHQRVMFKTLLLFRSLSRTSAPNLPHACSLSFVLSLSPPLPLGSASTRLARSLHTHTHTTHTHIHTHTHTHTHTSQPLRDWRAHHVYICIYTHTHTHMCIYVYICTHLSLNATGALTAEVILSKKKKKETYSQYTLTSDTTTLVHFG